MFHRSGLFLLVALIVCMTGRMASSQENDGRSSDGIQFLRQFAERGIAKAQLELALMYREGRGVQQNNEEAAEWLRKSAEQGNARAQFELGKIYEQGAGVKQDYAEAMQWYRKAAEQSLPQRPPVIGSGSGSGIGTGRGAGVGPGSGAGVGQGSGNGPYVAGGSVIPPVLLVQVKPQYTEEARRARVSGIIQIQCIVRKDGTVDSFKIMRGLGYGLEESAINTIASKWRFKPGTKDGVPVDVQIFIEVGFHLPGVKEDGGPSGRMPPAPTTSKEAAEWRRKLAEQGNARAQFELGKIYEQGTGVKQDYAEAMRWYRKAAEQGLPQRPPVVRSGNGIGPYVAGGSVTPPVPLVQVKPYYTEEARRARVSGIIQIQCVVRKDGTVDSFKVIRGLGYGLEESAIVTVASKWRFKPGTKDGVPVDVQTDIEVAFVLPGAKEDGGP